MCIRDSNYTLYLRKNNASRQSSPVTLQKQASTWLISDGNFGVEIPAAESLNVGVATGIILSEFKRNTE